MRLILALGALCLFVGPARAGERRYAITDFDRVVVEGPYQVRLTVAASSGASATGSQRALDEVEVAVQNRTLRIRSNRQAWGGYPGRTPDAPASLVLTTRQLRGATLAGAGALEIAGARGQRVELVLAGSGRLAATGLDADALALSARGSGTLHVAGRGGTVAASIEGAATLDGQNLQAQTLTIAAASSADIGMTAARTATIITNGSGQVIVTGRAACTVTGAQAAQVRCGPTAR